VKHNILIVDDDPNLLDGLRRQLHREPYTIITSTSCREALECLRTTPVDVIISDQDMPLMSGAEFLKLSRALSPNSIRFMLTGKATLDNAIEAVNSGGISRFFIKPCKTADLVEAIRQGIKQHRLMEAAHRLLQKNKRQSGLLIKLEREYPNISKVERDSDGAIRIDEFNGDLDRLLKDIDDNLNDS
jgi:two-component system probable response regulator PhcQ